jgi:hypothetical protein
MQYQYSDGGWSKDYDSRKKNRSDCVVRSIAIATGQTYMSTLMELCEIAVEYGSVPSCNWIWEKYLDRLGFIKCKTPRYPDGKKMRLRDWEYSGTCVMSTSGHLTAVKDNVVLDTWDCRPWCCNSYWELPN